jgi:D-glycero-D-manno-heptose 1,7-bisphosphate phosphatase
MVVHKRAVFLDRDGVLIKAIVKENRPYAVSSLDEVEIIDGAAQACAELSGLGFLLILVTNQPDVARGTISRAFVDQTNKIVCNALMLDDVFVCDHDNANNCHCRKPKPGLMLDVAKKYSLDLASCIVIGDRWRDIEAGRNAGCQTVFIDYGYDEQLKGAPDHICSSLAAAVPWIREQI